ncbi:MAG: hypothetical protein RLZZ214_2856, partial [Verrucomicrobiota bacterium]
MRRWRSENPGDLTKRVVPKDNAS